jgi:hypothetical protein
MPSDATQTELQTLLTGLTEGLLDAGEQFSLAKLLRSDAGARRFYHEYMEMHSLLLWRHAPPLPGPALGDDAASPKDLGTVPIFVSAEMGLSPLPPTPAPLAIVLGGTLHETIGYFSSSWAVSYLLATVITGLLLLAGSHIYVSVPEPVARRVDSLPSPLSPLPSVVGRITGMADCRWAEKGTVPFCPPGGLSPFPPKGSGFRVQGSGSNLSPLSLREMARVRADEISKSRNPQISQSPVSLGDHFALSSGLLEITYNTGAKVILQGPVNYEVESNGGFLSLGKLTGKLEKNEQRRTKNEELSAVSSSFLVPRSSFVIRTPSATVTDLGTEFGVEVSSEQQTRAHVFHGRVIVRSQHPLTSTGGVAGEVELGEDESASVTSRGVTMGYTGANAEAAVKAIVFVRQIPKQVCKMLDLVDIVAGGDGFLGRVGRGINAATGLPVVTLQEANTGTISGDHHYHRVKGTPFIDGVFIPDGTDAPVQLDSAGHICDWLGPTNNKTWGPIWAGGWVPAGPPGAPPINVTLAGTDYSGSGHRVLLMHANKGITFDLEAMRRAHPQWRLTRFTAVASNTYLTSVADLFVFVDGCGRFRRNGISSSLGVVTIRVPLSAHDRFLTLVAGDANDGIFGDWVVLGDPRLEMSPERMTIQSTNARQ